MKKMYFLLLLALFCKPLSGFGQQTITLITPYDKDTIETIYPVFSWYYLDPSGTRDDVRYVFTLVDLNNDQSAQAGVTVNSPLIRIEGIQGFQFAYPFDAPELQYNHRYGWRLQRKINGVITSESEAWEFILYKKVEIPMKYAVLNTDYNATTYEVNGEGFFFKLHSRYKTTSNLKYTVLNDKSEKMQVNIGKDEKEGENEELEKTGRDFYFLKTNNYPPGTYIFKVKDQKGNEYNTRFRVK